jgi:DNA-binding PadR family transcriptional regulator
MYGRHGRRHGRRLKRGVLKFVLLKLLAEMPRHGYDLIRAFREKGWGAGAGSIYPILGALEAAGLITGRDEGDRRTYEISEKGRQLLKEHVADFGRFFEDDDEEGDETEGQGDKLRESAGRLMRAISQLGPSSKPETIERVRELLDEVRKEVYKLLAEE